MKLFRLIFMSLTILTFSACVTTRSELNEKRAQQDGDSNAEVSSGNSSVKSEDISPTQPSVVETSKPEVSAPVTPAPVGSQYGMEEMRAELAKLTGRIEEMEQEKKSQQTSQTEEQNKLQLKVAELEKQLKAKEEQNSGPDLPDNKTAFQAGKDAYRGGHFDSAIPYFNQSLKTDENGKEAEEAYFLRGESYFQLKQYKKAILDYSKFPEKYSKSKYHSKALLKIAECFDSLGMKEDGQAFYQDLLDKFPKTAEGKLARKKLGGKTSKK